MILSSKEMIRHWTDAGAWGTKTFMDYFNEHVQKDPEKVCLVDPLNREALVGSKPERLTYRQLDQAASAVAEGLLARGIEKDDIIMVQLPNVWELAMLYLAITRAGALISPMPMQWRFSELKYIASMTDAAAMITIDTFGGYPHVEMAGKVRGEVSSIRQILTLTDIQEMAKGPVTGKTDAIRIDANDVFTLCWSSGTEAQPKGCPLTHNNWLFLTDLCFETVPVKPGDTYITAGPLVNMASIGTVFIEWLRGGGKLVLHHPFDGPTFILQLIMEEVHYTLLVPAVINGLLKHPKVDQFDLSKMRAITLGSAPPSLWSVQELKRRWGIEFGNIWGQNEGTANVSGAYNVPDMEMRVDNFPQYGKPGSSWVAKDSQLRHISLKVVDPVTQKELTQEGEVGQLFYKGPSVISGYFKRPDLSAVAFDKDGYFNTGDLFQIKKNDCIGFFDRTKDIIIRGGFNISAQEVENVLLGHPKIQEVAAVAMPDEIMGEKVCVYVVPREGETVTLEDVSSFMKESGMAIYKTPERVELIEAIPRNPVGKIMKNVLREDIRKKLAQA